MNSFLLTLRAGCCGNLLLFATLTFHMGALAQTPGVLLLIKLHASVPGMAGEDDLRSWAFAIYKSDPDFSLAQSLLLKALGG